MTGRETSGAVTASAVSGAPALQPVRNRAKPAANEAAIVRSVNLPAGMVYRLSGRQILKTLNE
jgi:hypothetical protein